MFFSHTHIDGAKIVIKIIRCKSRFRVVIYIYYSYTIYNLSTYIIYILLSKITIYNLLTVCKKLFHKRDCYTDRPQRQNIPTIINVQIYTLIELAVPSWLVWAEVQTAYTKHGGAKVVFLHHQIELLHHNPETSFDSKNCKLLIFRANHFKCVSLYFGFRIPNGSQKREVR